MEFLPGLIKMVSLSGLLFLYYRLFLQDRPHNQYNRIFLLGTIVSSVVIPFVLVTIPVLVNQHLQQVIIDHLPLQDGAMPEQDPLVGKEENHVSLMPGFIVAVIYITGVVFGLFQIVHKLIALRRLKLEAVPIMHSRHLLYYTNHPAAPFNFLGNIFWSPAHDPDSFEGQKILNHELHHCNKKHGWDLLFMEIILVVCWFNPFYYLIRKELTLVHEYAADAASAGNGEEIRYAEILLEHQILRKKNSLLLQFYHQPLKRRLFMLLKKNLECKSSARARIFALPLLLVAFIVMAFRIAPLTDGKAAPNSMEPLTIVIDAGHGGVDGGATAHGIQEKDINLAIAKTMASLAGKYNLNVVLTRSNDELPGGSSIVRDALVFRSTLGNQSNAALFISLHANNSDLKGVKTELYIAGKPNSSNLAASSRKAGSSILASLDKVIETRQEILQQKNKGIWVLDNSSIPAVLVEIGNMQNERDLQFITNPANQEKIAHAILTGIQQYVAGL